MKTYQVSLEIRYLTNKRRTINSSRASINGYRIISLKNNILVITYRNN